MGASALSPSAPPSAVPPWRATRQHKDRAALPAQADAQALRPLSRLPTPPLRPPAIAQRAPAPPFQRRCRRSASQARPACLLGAALRCCIRRTPAADRTRCSKQRALARALPCYKTGAGAGKEVAGWALGTDWAYRTGRYERRDLTVVGRSFLAPPRRALCISAPKLIRNGVVQ